MMKDPALLGEIAARRDAYREWMTKGARDALDELVRNFFEAVPRARTLRLDFSHATSKGEEIDITHVGVRVVFVNGVVFEEEHYDLPGEIRELAVDDAIEEVVSGHTSANLDTLYHHLSENLDVLSHVFPDAVSVSVQHPATAADVVAYDVKKED